MRTALVWIVIAETVALLGAAAALVAGFEPAGIERPLSPVFRPPLQDAVIGEFARYQVRARTEAGEDGEIIGYVDYEVLLAVETKGTAFGRTFLIEITRRDKSGRRILGQKKFRMRPRDITHGFFPPRFDHDERPLSVQPVIRTIRSTDVPFLNSTRPGFLVETVVPRVSLTQVEERYWFYDGVPLFGVSRWERPREVFVFHSVGKPNQ
jgi:hypothetical protein